MYKAILMIIFLLIVLLVGLYIVGRKYIKIGHDGVKVDIDNQSKSTIGEDDQCGFENYDEAESYVNDSGETDNDDKNKKEIAKLLNMDKYRLKNGTIEIFPSLQATMVQPNDEVYIEGVVKQMEIKHNNGDKAIVIRDNIASLTVMLIPRVLIDEQGLFEGTKAYCLNPMLYVNKQVNGNNIKTIHIKTKCVADITTITSSGRYIKIGATVTKAINIPLIHRNKPKIATVGLIIPLLNDTECCWIGSIVHCNTMMFSVTSVIRYGEPDVIKLVCVAVMPMTSDISIIETDESK